MTSLATGLNCYDSLFRGGTLVKRNDLSQATLREMIGLERPINVRASPYGTKVAFTVQTTNWKENRYESHCHIHDTATGVTHQLTRRGNVDQMEWIDDENLAVLRSDGEKAQIWIFESGGGEGLQVSEHKTGVEWFHPIVGGIVFLARDPDKTEQRARNDRYGKYTHFEQEESSAAVYFVGLQEQIDYQKHLRASTEEEGKKLVAPIIQLSKLFTEPAAIKEIIVAPAGDTLFLNCWSRDDLVYQRETRVFQIQVDARYALAKYLSAEEAKQAKKKDSSPTDREKEKKEDLSYLGKLSELRLPKGARVVAVSPDGSELLIRYQERDQMMYTREDLWLAKVKSVKRAKNADACLRAMTNITSSLDRDILTAVWTQAGIFGDFVDGTRVRIARLDPRGKTTPLDLELFGFGVFHVSELGHIVFSGGNATSMIEIYLSKPMKKGTKGRVERLTDFANQIEGWELGTVETIRWRSRDGVEIEGVLRKPPSFDPGKRHPLVFIVHGGPTWFSAEYVLTGEDLRYYPALQFNLKDMLVLKPNYRGSIGRGQAFQELNVNNLGVGDLWDLESAIDHLVELGWVDPDKVGCMGWSQGGYISAFAGLHSEKFKAVSVGAGVSDWYTYHISNDIPDFTRDYLSGSPFRERGLYEKTAPISNISKAKTPMLIQHGSDDRRVPLSNATELYRGLKEIGVPVELFVFPGMGHPITKPRENHAVMHQNLNWFSHYLLGEDLHLE
jgi:dipeptidyl aminopeptidase/acylaminoacyl peptidase